MSEYVQLPNGLLVPLSAALHRRPVAVDLFCGAGGFSLGFIQAGFHVIAGLDSDEAAAMTYLCNLGEYGNLHFHFATPEDGERMTRAIEKQWKLKRGEPIATVHGVVGSGWRSAHPDVPGVNHFFFGDARKWSGADMLALMGLRVGELDCVVGGPPCQGFSRAGRRDVMDPRNSLVFEFTRLVLEMQPHTLCMENVPEIQSMVTPEGIPVLDAMCMQLEAGGFGAFDSLKLALAGQRGARAAIRRPLKAGPELQEKLL